MQTEFMLKILLVLGYITASLILVTISIFTFYYLFMYLLNIKKARFMFFKIFLNKSVNDLNENEFNKLINDLEKVRKKRGKER